MAMQPRRQLWIRSKRCKLDQIYGITQDHVYALHKAGISSPRRLLIICYNHGSRAIISQMTGIPQSKLLQYTHFCDFLRIHGLGWQTIGALQEVRITTMALLASKRPYTVFERLVRYYSTGSDFHPNIVQVAGWVRKAQELPKIVVY